MDVEGIFFSYLPVSPLASKQVETHSFHFLKQLSHIYARFCEDVAFCAGASIGYTCGDNLRLLEDLQLLGPTVGKRTPPIPCPKLMPLDRSSSSPSLAS